MPVLAIIDADKGFINKHTTVFHPNTKIDTIPNFSLYFSNTLTPKNP
ncbi:MAG: hypothetical protein GF308_12665 [Candidatus Heimdallarchaeota archaeon]|nr:hypothetical protein [Candidatus Heimdallarchaeota archaeon]